MHPGSINIEQYNYHLPEKKIATHPLIRRDHSRLLIYQDGKISDSIFTNIDEYLPSRSLLVLNNTRVVEARILFQKQTGAVIEIFCLSPYFHEEVQAAMQQTGTVKWRCLIGGASKWKHGQILQKKVENQEINLALTASYISKENDHFIIQFVWTPDHLSFVEVLHISGEIPLPPYLHRSADSIDTVRYQTVYAQHKGSVAAPTAGLHFTEQVINKLLNNKIIFRDVTLHVGAGTFMPVKSNLLQGHTMHAEWIQIQKSVIEEIINNIHGNIIATGTTSLRVLESLYWIGVKLSKHDNLDAEQLCVSQWEPYDNEPNIEPIMALQAILHWLQKKKITELITETQILIAPGYRFRIVNALITNFHQPKSTLLLLIAAFIGDDWKKVYDYALKNEFRFLSYGDGSLLFRNNRLFQ